MLLRATRLSAIANAVRNLFRGASLNVNFAGADTLDPRITFTRASTATRVNASGVLESVAIDGPRFDYDPVTLAPKGLLIEEQRTNGIRNNTMVGAVAGTPGTLPTNWVVSGLGTLVQQVIGTGIDNGIAYVDIKFSGTTSSTSLSLRFETSSSTPASDGQSWASSAHTAVIGGTTSNISAIGSNANLYSASAFVGGITFAGFVFNTSPQMRRSAGAGTIATATTAFIQSQIFLSFASGVPIDITLRIGLPQLEQGAFATSPIPTTTAAATRAADVAVMTGANFSSWYNAATGAIFADYATTQQTGFPAIASASDGGNTNRIQISHVSSARRPVVTAGGVAQWDTNGGVLGSASSGVFAKFALAYEAANYAAAVNGGTPSTQTSGTVPSGLNRLALGADGASGNFINGHLRRISYFPRRLTSSELEGITK